MVMLVGAKSPWLAHKANEMVFIIALAELLSPFQYPLLILSSSYPCQHFFVNPCFPEKSMEKSQRHPRAKAIHGCQNDTMVNILSRSMPKE